LIPSRSKPICEAPIMVWGNKPVDGGNLILEDSEKEEFLRIEPGAAHYVRPLISAKEYLNGEKRWVIWLVDAHPSDLKSMPHLLDRIQKVKEMREKSVDSGARKLAQFPTTFRDTRNPLNYILIPSATSENRKYIPIGFFGKNEIAHNSCHMIPNGTLFHFGVLTSEIHMTWVRYICGRLKSDFRYSSDIVYNNFPWPADLSDKQVENVEKAAQAVLDARTQFQTPSNGEKGASLADLYDLSTMPPVLVKAHQALDKAVDLCYRPQPFPNETKRIEYLFELYDKYTAGIFAGEGKKKGRAKA